MIPRTDQFKECLDGSLEIRGVAQPLDLLTYLLHKLDAFLGVCDTLPRGADGSYLARDPRAGKIVSVRSSLEQVQMAAQVVLSSTLVPLSLRRTAPIADLARQLIFTVLCPEAESAIPAASIDRLSKMRDRLETLVMPTQTEAMRALQAELHRWVRNTPGARKWLETTVVPRLVKMWEEQQRLKRKQEPINAEHRARWMKARDSGIPFDEHARVVYDRELDPRHMSAGTIGRFRDEGNTEPADLAEAFFVVMLHDAGEAGHLHKLCPLLGDIEGLDRKFDWATLERWGTGLESDDVAPRFTPEAVEGMIERFKSRMPLRLEKPDGWTVGDLAKQIGKGKQTFRDMRKAAQLSPPSRGDHDFRYGPDDVERLATYLSTSTKPTWRHAGAKLRLLLND